MMSEPFVELLAPAGKWAAMEAVAAAGADAVYLGGKEFNMRVRDPKYNFSNRELEDAVQYLHRLGKKLYATVNNLYQTREMEGITDYLAFLEKIGVDALIVQDLGLVKIYKEMGLTVPLHASVQMGVASSAAARFFEQLGFSRIILSKNLTLKEISAIHDSTPLGIEFFAHGDLCVSHAGQCYMSSFMKGESGNRGRCIKPCRWKYSLHHGGRVEESLYRLAYKDLCVYDDLPALIGAGVSSMKIEGRMRTADYLAHLVGLYRRALDSLSTGNAASGDWVQGLEQLQNRRIRNFTTGNLHGRPAADAVDHSGAREPVFISRAFSLPELGKSADPGGIISGVRPGLPHLRVKVGDLNSLAAVGRSGIKQVILPTENFRQSVFSWGQKEMEEALAMAQSMNMEAYLEAPRIVSEDDLNGFRQQINAWQGNLQGVIANDWGSLVAAREAGLRVHGGYGLNVFNRKAAEMLINIGLERVTASLELGADELQELVGEEKQIEVLLHGPLCGMVSDFCPARATEAAGGEPVPDDCQALCIQQDYALEDTCGQLYRLFSDSKCRTYVYFPYDLCNLTSLPWLVRSGLQFLRIDGELYSGRVLAEIIDIYQGALTDLSDGRWAGEDYLERLRAHCKVGLTVLPDQSGLQLRD